MNLKTEINHLQKQLLSRLNVKKGSTMFIIIEAISRQAFAKSSFVVSQKAQTLAKKAGVTPNTISRNLRKLKEKCSDLITISQNRNCEEKFGALIFELQCISEMNIGCISEPVNTNNECTQVAEVPSNLSSKIYDLINIKNTSKDKETNMIVKQDVDHSETIHEEYINAKKQGINKTLFKKILTQVENKKGIRNFKAYLRGTIKNVMDHIENKKNISSVNDFYDYLESEDEGTTYSFRNKFVTYDWLNN